VKIKIAFHFACFLLFACLLTSASGNAQTIAYRQNDLASDLAGLAHNLSPSLQNPWGMAFQPGQPFFIANSSNGRALSIDAAGGAGLLGFVVPNIAGTAPGTPAGIAADPNSFFGRPDLRTPFILVTEEGGIYEWGPDAQGNFPPQATLVFNDSRNGAVFKGVVLLNSSETAPAVAVTDFHGGFIEAFLPGLNPVALPGTFTDPNLPTGYAPFGIQTIGNQVFVTFALQDAAKRNPIFGGGNGIVSIFDTEGNFVRRFATGGTLDAPWGITKASASFGPFSNDILIGNVGDGTINAFDPATGNFAGQVLNGDGDAIINQGLHALTFRSDGFGDPNTLYLTAAIGHGVDGVFAAITPGFTSVTRVNAPTTADNTTARITATVAADAGNSGNPSGTIVFQDSSAVLGTIPLANGTATLDTVLSGVRIHHILALYSGDSHFLPGSSRADVQVTGPATRLTLIAPATATPGSSLILTANITSAGGIPTGQIVFLDGNTTLGTAALDDNGSATVRIASPAAGPHSLTASYAGDGKFAGSNSSAVTLTVASPDFSLSTAPLSAMVAAGQSTQFMLTITPAGGFANNVTFSCAPLTGITCSFNPATVTPANGAASTSLTVTTSANISRYGLVPPKLIGPESCLAALALFAILVLRSGNLRMARPPLLAATAVLAIVGLSLTLGGCGGYGSATPSNRGTALVNIVAQSGAISHTTTVSVTVQ